MASSPSTTTQKVEPWDGAKAPLLDVYEQYGEALKNGKPEAWKGDTVADQSAQTKSAQELALAAANKGGSYLNNAAGVTNNIASTGGANTQAMNTLANLQKGVSVGSDPSTSSLQSLISKVQGGNAPGTSTYNNLMSSTNPGVGAANNVYKTASTTSNPTTANLSAMASGANIGNNPWLDQSIKNAQSGVLDQLKDNTASLNSAGAAFGRTGSGAQAVQQNKLDSTAATAMSKVATDMYANQYNTDTQNMLAANGQVSSNYNSDFQNLLSGAQQVGNSYAQNAQTQMGAAAGADANYQNETSNLSSLLGQLSQNYQQGVDNKFQNASLQQSSAIAANAASNSNANTALAAAGQAGNAYQNTLMPAETIGAVGGQKDAYNQQVLDGKIAQWDYTQQMPLQQLANYASILNGGNYQTTSTTTPGNSALTNILGGLTGAVGLGTKLFSLSDARFKENVKYLYTRDDGVKWYSYNYIGENDNRIGPMAQQLQDVRPELVTEFNGKLFISTKVFEREAA
jgi:hypothetical protein